MHRSPTIHPKITVCIVTYNRDQDLLRSLHHLRESEFKDFEVLVVDNGLSSFLPSLLRQIGLQQPLRLVQASENKGCANLNLLFPIAEGEVIACFDDDSYPAKECLGKVWELFKNRPSLGMIGFKMHVPETGEPWHDPWWNPNDMSPRPTVYCPGCGLAFRNDPRLPDELCIPDIISQAHELSMAAEITRLGLEIEFHPECIAYHPDTTLGYVGKKAEAGNLNQLKFLCRYGDIVTIFLVMLTQAIRLISGNPNNAKYAILYILSVRRKPLKARHISRFHSLISWNTHPRLHFMIRKHPLSTFTRAQS